MIHIQILLDLSYFLSITDLEFRILLHSLYFPLAQTLFHGMKEISSHFLRILQQFQGIISQVLHITTFFTPKSHLFHQNRYFRLTALLPNS